MRLKKGIIVILCILMTAVFTACGGMQTVSNGQTKLIFRIWDNAQRKGMQAVADAYTEKNPGLTIEVQVTSWDEYWTKLDAAAESNQLPDIFWMHTNELLKYADYGKLAELTDLYNEEDSDYFSKHFSEISLGNVKGSDGKIYGIPKDKDWICLMYNKEIFDAAGVAYPNAEWTWDDLTKASEQIYKNTGKYGYMAYADDQLGYWNFVYQAGGYILNAEKTSAGFTQPATKKAMEFYIGLQKKDWCPDQRYFAETNPGTAFLSGQGAMYLEGSWNLLSTMENNKELIGKWDVAVLPKCPTPESGDGRATKSNGLCYATGADNANLALVKDFLKFAGSKEGQSIQGKSGAAIPAYEGLEQTWVEAFDQFDHKLNVAECNDMFAYGVQSVNNASRPNWKSKINDELLKIYSNEETLEAGLENMQEIVNQAERP